MSSNNSTCPLPYGRGSVSGRGAVLAAALLAAACGGPHPEPKKEAEAAPIGVKTIPATLSDTPAFYEVSGSVRAQTEAAVSSRVMAYVREVRALTGDRVRAGQVLVVLDSRDLDISRRQAEAALREARSGLAEAASGLEAARAQLALARATFNRMKELSDKKSISNQEFDEATARLHAAEAAERGALSRRAQVEEKIKQAEEGLASVEVLRGYTEIRAPFEGRITEKKVEPGNLATPGAPLFLIEREGAYRLEAPVEESKLSEIQRGQRVSVTLDALDKTVDGTVAEIVPSVDPGSRSFLVKIQLPGVANLRSGVFGKARFTSGSRPALTVPAAAIHSQGQVQTVLVADQGYARARLVTTGAAAADRVEILSGLAAGDQIIFPRPAGLSDGARVEPKP